MQTNEQQSVNSSMITHQPLPFRFLVGNFLSCMQRELNFVRVRRFWSCSAKQMDKWILRCRKRLFTQYFPINFF